jgi:hypothetical protein
MWVVGAVALHKRRAFLTDVDGWLVSSLLEASTAGTSLRRCSHHPHYSSHCYNSYTLAVSHLRPPGKVPLHVP